MIDLNKLAQEAYGCALRRNKTTSSVNHIASARSIEGELAEFLDANEIHDSIHIPYPEAQEELADILIVCLTELHKRGVNVEAIIIDKINFNQHRD